MKTCAKRLLMMLYGYGWLSLETTQRVYSALHLENA